MCSFPLALGLCFILEQYGTVDASEIAEPGQVLLTVMANDADDPGTGSSKVVYSIADGDPNTVFSIASDDSTEQGILTVAKVSTESPTLKSDVVPEVPMYKMMAGIYKMEKHTHYSLYRGDPKGT